jgi:type IV pilus assembly protein PilC
MAKFMFVARDPSGNRVSGVEEAVNEEDLINRLQSREMLVISVSAATAGAESRSGGDRPAIARFGTKRHYGIRGSIWSCSAAACHFAGSGVTILVSLETISRQVNSTRLYNVIKSLQKDMEGGLSFHEALRKHKDVFRNCG